MDITPIILLAGLFFNTLWSEEYKRSQWLKDNNFYEITNIVIIVAELIIYINYFKYLSSKIVLIQLTLMCIFNFWFQNRIKKISKRSFGKRLTSEDFKYKITNKHKNKEKIIGGVKMLKRILGITSFILLFQLSSAKELNPYEKLQNYENSIHYGKNQNNVFIQYEQWQNLKRNIELENEYRYYFTERQKEEFRERNQLRYEKEVLNHFINMNRLEELNQRPNIYYYEQNNNYYRRGYYK